MGERPITTAEEFDRVFEGRRVWVPHLCGGQSCTYCAQVNPPLFPEPPDL